MPAGHVASFTVANGPTAARRQDLAITSGSRIRKTEKSAVNLSVRSVGTDILVAVGSAPVHHKGSTKKVVRTSNHDSNQHER